MKRMAVGLIAAFALVAGACGGGGDSKNSSDDGEKTDTNVVSNAAVSAAASKVCGGREAVNIGAAYASAMSGTGNKDYNSIADGLRAAKEAAPNEIEGDFAVLVEAEIPFLQALARANGNYMSLAQDAEFQAASEKLGSDEVKTASENINAWFTSHCK